MPFKIESHTSFRPSKENKESLSSSTHTDKKAAAVANRALEKSNVTWYTEKTKLPLAQNGNLPVTNRLSPDTVSIISSTLKGPKLKPTPPLRSDTTCLSPIPETSTEKPIPLPRSPTTCLSPISGHSEIREQKKAFGSELSAILNAKDALKPLKKKTPPPLPPRENKPKFEPISEPALTSLPERRVSFQIKNTDIQRAAKDRETNSPETPNAFAIKSILKKTSSSSNMEENIKSKEEAPKKELIDEDEWAEVYRILNECSEYLK